MASANEIARQKMAAALTEAEAHKIPADVLDRAAGQHAEAQGLGVHGRAPPVSLPNIYKLNAYRTSYYLV